MYVSMLPSCVTKAKIILENTKKGNDGSKADTSNLLKYLMTKIMFILLKQTLAIL